ncbi:MAG: DUF4384 domain-containing protein [Nitrospirota bacterium]
MRKISWFIFLFVPFIAFASEQPVWVESTGEAHMGEMDTLKDVKDQARRDAQTKALEKAVGVFIKSHTLVSNFQVADDLVYAAVRGKIKKTEVLQEGWDEKDRNRYWIKIKTLIEPVYPEKGQGLSLNVALSKTTLKEGEEVKIFYQATKECFVYIFSVAADGSVTLLFPNSLNTDNRILPNNAYEFPHPNSPIKLKAMFLPEFKGNVAEEKIKVIATRKEEPLIPLGFQEGMFQVFDAKSTGMIGDLVKKLNRIDPSDWTEATVRFSIIH